MIIGMMQMETNTKYKGFIIVCEVDSHCALIYSSPGELVKCVAGDIKRDGSHNAIEKAKTYIDNLK